MNKQNQIKRKTEFTAEEIQTALNNLNKGVQFVSAVEVVQKATSAAEVKI